MLTAFGPALVTDAPNVIGESLGYSDQLLGSLRARHVFDTSSRYFSFVIRMQGLLPLLGCSGSP